MKKITYLLMLIVIVAMACKSQEKNQDNKSTQKKNLVPGWVNEQLESWENENYQEVGVYQFKSDTVFLAVPPCCDRFSELYNYDGDLICHPSGGITGDGDGKCPDFTKEATHIKQLLGADKSP